MLPRRYPLISKHQKTTPQLMVVGSGRNGSTMLGSMLNMHPEILLVPEQFALFYSIQRYKLLNFLEWSDIVKIVVGEFARTKATIWDTDISNVYDILYALPEDERSLQKILDVIYIEYGTKNEIPFSIWGDKTPQNTLHIESIFPVFPNAKYLFLIRDGRDVISSYSKSEAKYMGEHSKPENAVDLWNQSIEAFDFLKKNCDPANLHIMRYEDLVSDPESTLRSFCSFMEISFNPEMLNFQKEIKRMGVADMAHHQNVAKKVSASSIGKWETGLTEAQKTKFIPLIEENLKRWEYL